MLPTTLEMDLEATVDGWKTKQGTRELGYFLLALKGAFSPFNLLYLLTFTFGTSLFQRLNSPPSLMLGEQTEVCSSESRAGIANPDPWDQIPCWCKFIEVSSYCTGEHGLLLLLLLLPLTFSLTSGKPQGLLSTVMGCPPPARPEGVKVAWWAN